MATGQLLRGLVGQGMDGQKAYSALSIDLLGLVDTTAPGTGVITASRPSNAIIFAFGPGGSGSGDGSQAAGGGGGAALFRRVKLGVGQSIFYTVGTPGAGVLGGTTNGNSATDTLVTLPNRQVLTAGGGKGGTDSAPGAGGLAMNGSINRNGGTGGALPNGLASSGGFGGGAGGNSGSFCTGGGGGAGFSDIGGSAGGGSGSDASNGGTTSNGGPPGGGSGGGRGSASGTGGSGRVVIWLLRAI